MSAVFELKKPLEIQAVFLEQGMDDTAAMDLTIMYLSSPQRFYEILSAQCNLPTDKVKEICDKNGGYTSENLWYLAEKVMEI